MPLDYQQYNADVTAWSEGALADIKSTAGGMDVKHRPGSPSSGPSVAKIRKRIGYQQGAANKISFTFPRSLIWPQKGAGKGRGGSKGSRWIDKLGTQRKTDPRSLGKAGTGGRTEKPFINNSLNKTIEDLADIAAAGIGGAITDQILIK